MKRLVWALCRAYSSLVSNHLVINNKISEWIRVVADTNGRDKKVTKQRSRLILIIFYSVTGCHAWHTHTHTNTVSLSRSHNHTYMHTIWYTTVVKHEAWILVNQSACQTERQSVSALFFTRLISKVSVRRLAFDWPICPLTRVCWEPKLRCGGRHSGEWHHSLLKLKDKNASSKHLKNFKILYFFFSF